MVKLKDFHIVLDNNKNVYTAGDFVSGHVAVDLRGDMKMRGIRIYMRGLAKVNEFSYSWTKCFPGAVSC